MRITSLVHDSAAVARARSCFESIEYRVARTREELEAAYGLVYREYVRRNYAVASPARLRLTVFNAFPPTTTCIAVLDGQVVSTATIFPDSPVGLPMDGLYAEELNDRLRSRGKRICEIGMLASDTRLFPPGTSLMLASPKLVLTFSLFKLIYDYVTRELELDALCVAINPKHQLTYDYLTFQALGGLKSYGEVNGAPAIAKYLECALVPSALNDARREGLRQLFLERSTPPDRLAGRFAFGPEDLRYFLCEKTDVLMQAPPAAVAHLRGCYPACDLEALLATPAAEPATA